MLIIGAGGLAAQIFPDIKTMYLPDVAFWSEYETRYPFIKESYEILTTDEQAAHYFNTVSRSFILAVGLPAVRRKMAEKFTALGGTLSTFISPVSNAVSPYAVIETGATILSHTMVEPGTTIKTGVLMNKTSNVAHGCIVGEYCELGPAVILTGEVEMGEDCYIGTGTIILPRVKMGRRCTVAAGAVIKKNIPANSLVSGGTSAIVKTIQEA
ncbi:MAG: hypothetical protein H7Y31_13515 [Chitinophagaceae bacterium]|nr:hypothetical protein [Chitinophagaceae bacterium]